MLISHPKLKIFGTRAHCGQIVNTAHTTGWPSGRDMNTKKGGPTPKHSLEPIPQWSISRVEKRVNY